MTWPSPDMHPDWREWARAMIQALSFPENPERLQPYVKAKLPQAARAKYMMVYCTDIVPPQPVYSDGVNWKRVTDGATA